MIPPRRRGRALLLALLGWSGAAVALGGCRSTASGKETTVKQNAEQAVERARKAVAKALGRLFSSGIEVEVLSDAEVPGVVVFRARDGKAPDANHRTGVVTEAGVELDRERATAIILRAWGYGPARSVPPLRVAEVIGFIQGGDSLPSSPVTDPVVIEQMKPSFKAHVTMPLEFAPEGEAGTLGVQWWVNFVTAKDLGPLLTRTRLFIPRAGAPRFEETNIADVIAAAGKGP